MLDSWPAKTGSIRMIMNNYNIASYLLITAAVLLEFGIEKSKQRSSCTRSAWSLGGFLDSAGRRLSFRVCFIL